MIASTSLIQPTQIGRKFRSRSVVILSFSVMCAGASGQGKLPPCNKTIPTSQWTNCVGLFITNTGSRYVGEFKDGKPEGRATVQFLANDPLQRQTYVGEVFNNRFHGRGVLYFSDGRPPEEGIWEKSVLVRAERIPNDIAGRSHDPKSGWSFKGLLEK
jgi:hypothetical protein